jgi:UDP-3-O-[3-hydroxymyristoyl] N-acetylglucosamine deacetylase
VIKKTVEVVDDKIPTRFMRVEPAKQPLISYAINFEDTSAIGYQSVSLPYTAKVFCEELSFARTFCLKEEIDHMHARGLAQGGSLENAIVVSKNYGILNTQGLRHAQEFVKHKILDCIGDLYLLGMPLLGHVVANRAGHDLHIKLAKAILDQVNSYSVVSLSPKEALRFETLFTFPKSLAELQLNFKFLARG